MKAYGLPKGCFPDSYERRMLLFVYEGQEPKHKVAHRFRATRGLWRRLWKKKARQAAKKECQE